MTKTSHNQSGFTLIEIMVALFIVAVGLLAVSQAMSRHTELAASLDQRLKASWVASDQMAMIRHQAKLGQIPLGSKNKTVKVGNRKWNARQKITKTDVDGVYLVMVEVYSSGSDQEKPHASLTSAVSSLLGI